MLFWKRKTEPEGPTPQEIRKAERFAIVQELRAWKPVGSRLQYLGRSMLVCHHARIGPTWDGPPGTHPELGLQYLDNNGMVHSLDVPMPMAVALMRGDPRDSAAKRRACDMALVMRELVEAHEAMHEAIESNTLAETGADGADPLQRYQRAWANAREIVEAQETAS